jgi:hypothetical protein
MDGKSKNRRRPAEGFLKFSTVPLTFKKYKQKCGTSEKMNGNAMFSQ